MQLSDEAVTQAQLSILAHTLATRYGPGVVMRWLYEAMRDLSEDFPDAPALGLFTPDEPTGG